MKFKRDFKEIQNLRRKKFMKKKKFTRRLLETRKLKKKNSNKWNMNSLKKKRKDIKKLWLIIQI